MGLAASRQSLSEKADVNVAEVSNMMRGLVVVQLSFTIRCIDR